MTNFFFQICSLFYITLLIIVYFNKKRIPSVENKFFIIMAIANLIGLILDILSVFTIKNMQYLPFINLLVSKSYLMYLLTFISFMTIYNFCISKNKNIKQNELFEYYRKISRNIIIVYIISILLVAVLPLNFFNQNNVIYSYGPAANFLYLISGVYIVIWVILMIKNFKQVKSKK